MEAMTIEHHLQCSSYNYYKDALDLLNSKKREEALRAIDAAIILSSNSPFYIYQKLKFLLKLSTVNECSHFIVSQLPYLYKNSSLYIVCRFIDHYQKQTSCTTSELEDMIISCNLPYCLAEIYSSFLTSKLHDFLPQIKAALIKDQFFLCISYCDLHLKLDPNALEALYYKAYAYQLVGDLYQAKNFYSSYLEKEQTNARVYMYLGLVYMELTLYDEALKYLKTAIALEPNNKDFLTYIGECYYLAKNFTAAAEIYEKIEEKFPLDLQNCFNLSHTYCKLNKRSAFKRYNRKIKKALKTTYKLK